MSAMVAQAVVDNQILLAQMPGRCQALLAREPELRAHCLEPDHYDAIRSCHSSIASALLAVKLYRDRLCFGERPADGSPRFDAITYGAFWERMEAFAAGLTASGLARSGQFVGICAAPSIDWMVVDFACLYLGLVSVPLPTTMTDEEFRQVMVHVDLACVICSAETKLRLAPALTAANRSSTRFIITGQHADGAGSERDDFTTLAMADVEAVADRQELRAPVDIDDQETMRTLLYTSGSSGSPNGAMFPERIWKLHWQGGFFTRVPTDLPYITLAYLPLSHAMGRAQVINSFIRGGLTCFTWRSDMSSLLEDIALVRPTQFSMVPRVAAMIQKYADLPGATPNIMGDRLLVIAAGSALMPPDLQKFLQTRFHAPVLDGYGSTEAGLVTYEGRINHESVTAFRLVDRPELGYQSTDLPHPRGELLVKTKYMISGYFRDETSTKGLFDEAGFLRTGDIVEQRGEDVIIVIDRARNVIKLSHGEFVNIARLENLYVSGGGLIRQIYLLGVPEFPYLMSVIVPDMDACLRILGGVQDGVTQEDNPALRDLLQAELYRLAHQNGLRGFEVPQLILVSREPFTRENGLLTETLKPARGKLRARFQSKLLALSEANAASNGAPTGESVLNADEPLQQFAALVHLALGRSHLPSSWTDCAFVHIGGDSMAAVRLSMLCARYLDLNLPASHILDPSIALRELVPKPGDEHVAEPRRPEQLFARVHGDGSNLAAADLDLNKFLPPYLSGTQANVAAPLTTSLSKPSQVLLTGANGFFGRAILLRLLHDLPQHGRVYCLVRGANDDQARARLKAAMDTDAALAVLVEHALESGKIHALAGNVAQPMLGLPAAMYQRLLSDVDHVVHNGALVNHVFDYQTLFEPNVVGTAEIIAFALTGRLKPICMVSTVGVVVPSASPDIIVSARDVGASLPSEWSMHGYAWGYAGSKWAAEILLQQAHERYQLPVAVMRPGWLLTHRDYAGQINENDLFSRLLFGIVRTGMFPPGGGDQLATTFSSGVPVDEAAAVLVGCLDNISSWSRTGPSYRVCHLEGSSTQLITMGDLTREISEAGYRAQWTAPDARSWHSAFIDALRNLPEKDRLRSPLSLLEDWNVAEDLLWGYSGHASVKHASRNDGFPPLCGGVVRSLISKSLSDLVERGTIPHAFSIA